jgi:hypothetical protein
MQQNASFGGSESSYRDTEEHKGVHQGDESAVAIGKNPIVIHMADSVSPVDRDFSCDFLYYKL